MGGPGGRMHPVGDRVDRIIGEHLPRNLAVLHGNAVDEARRRQGHVGHIEHPVVTATHALEQAGNLSLIHI